MEIKNLAQLKRAMQNNTPFVILRHYVRPEYEGQTRVANVNQTNGFYSVVQGDPAHPVSKSNNGRGSWLDYGKASDWEFDGEVCKRFDHRTNGSGERRAVWEIRFVEP